MPARGFYHSDMVVRWINGIEMVDELSFKREIHICSGTPETQGTVLFRVMVNTSPGVDEVVCLYIRGAF